MIKLTLSKFHTLSKILKNLIIIMIPLKIDSFYLESLAILKSKILRHGNQCQIAGFAKNGNILWLLLQFILWSKSSKEAMNLIKSFINLRFKMEFKNINKIWLSLTLLLLCAQDLLTIGKWTTWYTLMTIYKESS